MSKYLPQISSILIACALQNLAAQEASTPAQTLKTPIVGETTLPEVVVTGEGTANGYAMPETTTSGLKTNTRLLETPQSIAIVPQALIRDQDARTLGDAIENVAGVTVGGYYSEWDYYRIRGFDAAFTTYVDGLRGDYDGIGEEPFNFERVEVIKGPASSLYGQAPLGGIVNIVSKKPKREFGGEVTFTAGSWSLYEGTVDINIPIVTPGQQPAWPGAPASTDMGVYFRFLGLYNSHSSYVDYYDYDRIFVAPSVTFEWGDETSLTFLMHYKKDDGQFSMPLPAKGTVLYNPNGEIPISRFIGIPGETGAINMDTFRLSTEFKHRFSEMVSIRQNMGYYRVRQNWNNILYNFSLANDKRTLYTNPYQYDQGLYQRFMADNALDLEFDTGSIEHFVTLGIDYYYSNQKARYREIDYNDFPGSFVAIDLFNPDYDSLKLPPYATSSRFHAHEYNLGIYFQDHAKITEQLTLTLGGRYDFLWADDNGSYGSAPYSADDGAFSPKAGITYEFIKDVAAYANWSRAFRPQWAYRDNKGRPVGPEEGENFEMGVKYALFDGKLSGIMSGFYLTRQNVATSNLITPDPSDSTVSGEQRTRGFEFEVSALPVDGLEITSAYTYIDGDVTEDNDIPVGTPLQGVPKHMFTGWAKYTLQEGPLEGFGVGFGGRYYSKQSGDTYHTFDLPAYGLLDAALYYERGNFSAQVNFKNLADKRHFVGSSDELYVLPGEPFNVSGSITWKF